MSGRWGTFVEAAFLFHGVSEEGGEEKAARIEMNARRIVPPPPPPQGGRHCPPRAGRPFPPAGRPPHLGRHEILYAAGKAKSHTGQVTW